jgi:hypothetical protein
VRTDSKSINLYTITAPRKNDKRYVSNPIGKRQRREKKKEEEGDKNKNKNKKQESRKGEEGNKTRKPKTKLRSPSCNGIYGRALKIWT